eukprot:SAG31_NODE_4495_length_3187_cov_2.373057_1_plen_100_part_00
MNFPLKLVFCSDALKQMAARSDIGFQHATWCKVGLMRSDYTLVHVLIPDMRMRFPGDPGCDMSYFSYAAPPWLSPPSPRSSLLSTNCLEKNANEIRISY